MIWRDRVTESDDQASSRTRAQANSGPTPQPRTPRRRDSALADRARLRHLAAQGLLGTLGDEDRRRLLPAAFEVAYPIVHDVTTRRRATAGLDRFQDDLETVIDQLMSAATPIHDLEGWLARRARDGHRDQPGRPPAEPDLADLAVRTLQTRLRRGDDPTVAVIDVLTTLFQDSDSAFPADPAALSVLVQRVLAIVRGTG